MAVAIEYHMYHDNAAVMTGKASQLNNVLKVPVILAAEMIQYYHKYELPRWLQDAFPKEQMIIPIFKPYEELEKSIQDVARLPITINHVEVDMPENDHRAVGWVKDLWADPKDRKIKGYAYFDVRKISHDLCDKIKNGAVVDVSIGGSTLFASGGKWNQRTYSLKQIGIKLNHLAALPGDKGRCPAGTCGLNMDSAPNLVSLMRTILHPIEDESTILKMTDNVGQITVINEKILAQAVNGEPIYSSLPKEISHLEKSPHFSNTPLLETNTTMPTPQEEAYLKQIQQLQSQVASLRDSASAAKIQEYQEQISTLKIEKSTLETAVSSKDTEITALKTDLEDKKKTLDEIEAKEKETLVKALAGTKLYEVKDLEPKCIKELRIMQSTLQKAGGITDAAKEQFGFPKPNEAAFNQAMNKGGNTPAPIGDAAPSYEDIYGDGK